MGLTCLNSLKSIIFSLFPKYLWFEFNVVFKGILNDIEQVFKLNENMLTWITFEILRFSFLIVKW